MSHFCDKKRRLDEKEKNVNIESKTKGMDHLVDFFNPQKDHSYTGRIDDKMLLEDKLLLKDFKEHEVTKYAVFVIYRENFTNKQFRSVSEKIAFEMKSAIFKTFDGVLCSLFTFRTDDIGIRISLLLERHLLEQIECTKPESESLSKILKEQNEIDLLYHKLKHVCIRNEMIREFGHEDNQMFVSIDDITEEFQIRSYLRRYIHNEDKIEIRLYTKMVMTELGLKSGDRVASLSNQKIGTVGLSLRNGTHHYSATCKHVVDSCLTDISDFGIEVESENIVIMDTFRQTIQTISVYSPSVAFDFSVIKLHENISISPGIRNRSDLLVSGRILDADTITLPNKISLYKWGTVSGLTVGKYKGRREEIQGSPKFLIQSTDGKEFANKGDSGSLVCLYYEGSEIAAFILSAQNGADFVGLSLRGALRSCEQQLPHINACINA